MPILDKAIGHVLWSMIEELKTQTDKGQLQKRDIPGAVQYLLNLIDSNISSKTERAVLCTALTNFLRMIADTLEQKEVT